MSIRHNNNQEIRYIKHQNLKEEARIIANYYRDLIHAYGMDCTYYKSTVDLPPEFSKIINSNNILKRAYGYDPDISFNLSSNLITYTEVDEDIFVLDRIGHKNDQKISFYFDATEFSTSFMTSLGQFKEYPIYEKELTGKLDDKDGRIIFEAEFNSDVLSGTVKCDYLTELDGGVSAADNITPGLDDAESIGAKPETVLPIYASYNSSNGALQQAAYYPITGIASCIVTSQSTPKFNLPVNEYIARTFTYGAQAGDVAIVVYFKYKINKDRTYTGKLVGTVLYYDLKFVSKYVQEIKPNVGDIIVLDTSWGNIVYEVNEVQNQGITQNDSLNPLMYKYIFKITAQKRINSYEGTAPVEDITKFNLDIITSENVDLKKYANEISPYHDNDDIVYGGFTGKSYIATAQTSTLSNKQPEDNTTDDNNTPAIIWDESSVYGSTYINILTFGNNTTILTDGINLFFKNTENTITKITTFVSNENATTFNNINSNLRFIKADAENLYFQNINGDITIMLSSTDNVNLPENIEYIDDNTFNENGMNFYKFKNCKTLLFSTPYNLFCRLEKTGNISLLA